jgi:NNP family nitrate/nitrite transporter-like MFS transporter
MPELVHETGVAGDRAAGRTPWPMLTMATIGFALTFWAWALLSPLGPSLREDLGLTSFEQAVLIAVPVIVGSLGRIPVGALTDRFGARVMFPLMALLTVAPVLYLGHVASSYAQYLVGGFFLGFGGTTFAIGIPFVNAWFPPARRGTALGLFGMGMGGTAISAFTTVRLTKAYGPAFPFDLVAVLLVVYAVAAWVVLRDRADRPRAVGSWLARTWSTLRLRPTIELALLYAVSFGGFVAFSVYLPTYLKTAYALTQGDAASRTAGFVVIAVLMRPVGGWLSDRIHPVKVLAASYAIGLVLAVLAALELALVPLGTAAFLGLAAALGLGTGGVFALVSRLAPADRVGSVTGVVGAAGGLGGFFPPLVMGAVYGITGDYSLGFALLAGTALLALAYTWLVIRPRVVG